MADTSKAIERLVKVYREATISLVNELLDQIDFERGGRARTFAAINRSLAILKDLDSETEKWALREIPRIYRATLRQTAKSLRRLGLTKRNVQRAKHFAAINPLAVEALVNDPDKGLVTSLKNANSQIRRRIRSIRQKAKILRRQQGLIGETIARVGVIEGRSITDVRDALVNELKRFKKAANLVTRNQLMKSGNEALRQMAELTFVKIPTTKGDRHVRLDDYAETVARTKTRQAVTVARRAKMMQHDQLLVRISRNKPLHDDACGLYIGKVFALSREAALEHGVPHVDELPGGGTPFHPNCTHNEIPFSVDLASEADLAFGMTPPPKWALNRTWTEVEREFRKKGIVLTFGRETGGRQRRA